jgi:hypothetical protein
MREAKYARQAAAAPARPRVAPAPVAPPTASASPVAGPAEDLCGHKSMNGRACTREAGHAEKSHRYS